MANKRDWDQTIRAEGIKFFYFRTENRIVATICYKFLDTERTKCSYAFALTNRMDQCNKRIGRVLAYNRFTQMNYFAAKSPLGISIGAEIDAPFVRMLNNWEFLLSLQPVKIHYYNNNVPIEFIIELIERFDKAVDILGRFVPLYKDYKL